MKKVVFVIGCLGNGGAERVVTSISDGLIEKGFDVSILTFYKDSNEYKYSSKINRINISNGDKKDYNKLSAFKRLKLIRKSIKQIKPDKIICFMPQSLIYVYYALYFSKYRKKIAFAVRSNPLISENKKITKLQMHIVKKINRIITQNQGQALCFSKQIQSKIVVIPNPMYDELFEIQKKYCDKVEKIVSVGRLVEKKNYNLSIEAFYEIHKTNPKIKYYIYGSGPDQEKLQQKINDLNLQENVILMGFENNRNIIYPDKDIYLMTSKYEGMPNTLAEAMTIGLPSISTNCDFGPSDLIINDDMGILVNDYEVKTIVDSLNNMINNYDLFVKKAKYAKEILRQNYSYEKILEKWIDFIRK